MITYHPEVEQGSEAWLAMRCGLLTASEMRLIVTPPPKVETRIKKDGTPYKQREMTAAENDACRAHLFELASQRISGHVEPHYISDDMLRGREDELLARALYAEKYAPVREVGFVTNDEWGFTIGYSPDGLVGDDGLIECKSRRQKFQVETICAGVMPADYVMQVQTGLLVTGRAWCDFISYSGGLPMVTLRVFPDAKIQDAIIEAATIFEEKVEQYMAAYEARLASEMRLIPTERRVIEEMF